MTPTPDAGTLVEHKCEDCGFQLARGELDRSGQEWWCPVCAKAGIRLAENKRLREALASSQKEVAELREELLFYRQCTEQGVVPKLYQHAPNAISAGKER